uniref:Uncharacterized protein n=1 Tax=Oryza punctata TaxID=4537 RepID=A0A0E0LZ86_ORYPU
MLVGGGERERYRQWGEERGGEGESWYELETTPYLRQVLNDLHNVVRGLKEEKSDMRASLVSARAQIDELTAACNGDVADWRRKRKEKDDLACKLRARSWYELETTPYLRQVLNDLHNVVRGLKEEKSDMRASLVSARAQIDELTAACNGDVADWRRKRKEKDDLACKLRARVVELEEGRKFPLSTFAGLVLLTVALWLRG